MRALDGFSERSIRDNGSDKSAGRELSKEVMRLCKDQAQDGNTSKSSQDWNFGKRQSDSQKETAKAEARREQQTVREQSERREQLMSKERTQREQQLNKEQNLRSESRMKKPAAPSIMDFGGNWKKDDSGNFVTRDRSGRLLTRNESGKLVDYTSQMNKNHMAQQDQMAFASILFCNPLMLLGMGATFAMMDQAHGAKTQRMSEQLNKQFDGKQANNRAMQNGYASDLNRKALLISQYIRPVDARDMSNVAGLAGSRSLIDAAISEEARRRKRPKDQVKRPETKASMPVDRYAMSAKKLMKTKKLLEEHIEKVRGQASLEEVSRLYAQVEVLDRALKRLANF